jgi:predicted DNA-binding transcriptional regulator AlpA
MEGKLGKRLLPDPLVCRRYNVSAMTIWRWDHDPQLDFPKPIRIRGRKYRDEDALDAFDARMVATEASGDCV